MEIATYISTLNICSLWFTASKVFERPISRTYLITTIDIFFQDFNYISRSFFKNNIMHFDIFGNHIKSWKFWIHKSILLFIYNPSGSFWQAWQEPGQIGLCHLALLLFSLLSTLVFSQIAFHTLNLLSDSLLNTSFCGTWSSIQLALYGVNLLLS